MAKVLRGYQTRLIAGIEDAWRRGARCVIATTATGGGKTPTKAALAMRCGGMGIIQAHRSELVGQISEAMAEEGLRHNIIGSSETVRDCVDRHLTNPNIKASWYDPRARWHVASVDMLYKKAPPFASQVNWFFTDEGHHVLRDNKWGRAWAQFPNARGLLMTATPTRSDGMGLGSHHDGIADALVIGPGLGELIRDGYLVEYDVYAATTDDLDMSDVTVGASGEYNQEQSARAVKRSKKIVGNVVNTYRRVVPGKQAIVFAVDTEHAQTITDAFIAAGVAAAFVNAKSKDKERTGAMRDFKARKLNVLVNVDLFGEGVDVAGVDVVIMARPTASFSYYSQMIGRMLRLAVDSFLMSMWDTFTVADRKHHIANSSKPRALLIDHVGNTSGTWKIGDGEYANILPEAFMAWTLDRRGKKARANDGTIPSRICEGCFKKYLKVFDACPHCGKVPPEPAGRGTPQEVEGDVFKLNPEVLAAMRAEIRRVDDMAYAPKSMIGTALEATVVKNHRERQHAQKELRDSIALWAGHFPQYSDSENHKRFFYLFGVDVVSAMALGVSGADKLRERIHKELENA